MQHVVDTEIHLLKLIFVSANNTRALVHNKKPKTPPNIPTTIDI